MRFIRHLTDESWDAGNKRDEKSLSQRLESVSQLGNAETVPVHMAHLVAEAYMDLEHLERALPEVECWLVVKHYKDVGESTWDPKPWLGCLLVGQAKKFAAALQLHYGRGDKFKVERGQCRVGNILTPSLTTAEYLLNLGCQ